MQVLRVAIGVAAISLLAGQTVAQQTTAADLPDPEEVRLSEIERLGVVVPNLNMFGEPGVLDMPDASMLPDGELTASFSAFADQFRLSSYFQLTPWLGFGFRYSGVRNTALNNIGFDPYYDRGFDVRLRLAKEGRIRPAITLGMRDFAGTGIYASEYLVATKTFTTPSIGDFTAPGRLKATAGLGWGRMGSFGSIGSTGERGREGGPRTGGSPEYDEWFRGDFAPFGALEWQPTPRWRLLAEYSSDAYVNETVRGDAFVRRTAFNFGADYQWTRRSRVGLSYMFGDAIGFKYQFSFDPRVPLSPMAVLPAPRPIERRPNPSVDPGAYATDWADSQSTKLSLKEELEGKLRAQGAYLENLALDGDRASIWLRNTRYYSQSNLVGRTARIFAETLPASVEVFEITLTVHSLPTTTVVLTRHELETLEFESGAADKLLASATIRDAQPVLTNGLGAAASLYPDAGYNFEPYFEPGFFDPDVPFRLDVGVALRGFYRPSPGWIAAGALRYRLAGNLDEGRESNSVLPRVRTDQNLYAQEPFEINNLFGARYAKLRPDVYGRVTFGYLEQMFGGLSTEVLWKPTDSVIGFGVEANYVAQRDFDGLFGFQDYRVFTGHASLYTEFGDGYLGQIDAGRYLAGDIGASFRLNREFDNGWQIGAFFTLTDVSAEEFGEGSFDKGFLIRIPVAWFTGAPNATVGETVVRIVQRDGGQVLQVPGRLYGSVRNSHARALTNQWARVWQ